jgi:hypothetical protein
MRCINPAQMKSSRILEPVALKVVEISSNKFRTKLRATTGIFNFLFASETSTFHISYVESKKSAVFSCIWRLQKNHKNNTHIFAKQNP